MPSYTKEEMLALWRRARGVDHKRSDITIVRATPVDNDQFYIAEMDDWYARLLDEAEERHVVARRPALSSADVSPTSVGVAIVRLPEGVRRVLHVKVDSWPREATVIHDDTGRLAALQFDPFTRTSAQAPLAIHLPGRGLLLAPAPSLCTIANIERFDCTILTPDLYEFQSSALTTIPKV